MTVFRYPVLDIQVLRDRGPHALASVVTPNPRYFVEALGHSSMGDGGGGMFAWDPTDSDADDDGMTILPTGFAGVGRWVRVLDAAEPLTPQMFGVTGTENITVDVLDTLQYAIDHARCHTLFMTPGTYHVRTDYFGENEAVGALRVPHHTALDVGPDATIKAMNTAGSSHDVVVSIDFQVEGATITGKGTIDGNRAVYSGPGTGNPMFEQGHAVWPQGNNQIVEDITCANARGDGVYYGTRVVDLLPPLDGRLSNVTSINCGRQGLSIVAADGLVVNNFVGIDILGVAPQSAIDIEPSDASQICRNISIIGGYALRCGTGMNVSGPDDIVENLVIDGFSIYDSINDGLNIRSPKSMTIDNMNILNSGGEGLKILGTGGKGHLRFGRIAGNIRSGIFIGQNAVNQRITGGVIEDNNRYAIFDDRSTDTTITGVESSNNLLGAFYSVNATGTPRYYKNWSHDVLPGTKHLTLIGTSTTAKRYHNVWDGPEVVDPGTFRHDIENDVLVSNI